MLLKLLNILICTSFKLKFAEQSVLIKFTCDSNDVGYMVLMKKIDYVFSD